MKTLFTPFIGALLLLAAACAPQAELIKTKSDVDDLRAEVKAANARVQELQKHLGQDVQKRIESIDANTKSLAEMQKTIADYGAKTDELSTDIQLLQGKLEENNFRIADLSQKVDDKSFKINELSAKIDELEGKLKALSAGQGLASGATGSAEKKAGPKSIGPSDAYRQAMNDYTNGNYDLALAGFQNYLTQFPDSTQADKAQYWVGECYYAKQEYGKAIDAFAKVVKAYPKSDKVPGAKLKIAYSYLQENNHAKAKEWLRKVIKEYPGSKEADLAKGKLHKLGK